MSVSKTGIRFLFRVPEADVGKTDAFDQIFL